jgi:hypothetical protein
MLGNGGDADEENQNADDVSLEPQDGIGVHGIALKQFFTAMD